ncbi:MAG: hypothetical protein GC161_16515 [Planctomycetaceae bacterium]|nr:hypothetical protein [Planctomycetaceae bacterium]
MKPRTFRPSSRGGFTLWEIIIASGILGIVIVNVSLLLRATSDNHNDSQVLQSLDLHARQTLDRIVIALQSAAKNSVIPAAEAPLYSSAVDYDVSLGVEDGVVVWGEPERIGLQMDTGEVLWFRSMSTEDERRVVWGRHVRPVMAGESPGNGLDDNANGIIDELGLSFTVDGDSVRIRMTLERENTNGAEVMREFEQIVSFRN